MNKITKCLLLFLFILTLPLYSNSQETGDGSTSFPILGISFDSRSAALSNSSAALPFSGTSSSPASQAFINRYTACLSYRQHFTDVRGGAMFFGIPANKFGVISAALQFLSLGSFEGTLYNAYNEPIEGDMHPYSAVLTFSWSKLFKEHYAAGISFKYLHDKLSNNLNSMIQGYTIKGVALDFGLQYQNSKSKLDYGIVIKNLGSSISSSEDLGEIELPLAFSAGIAFKPSRIYDTRILLELEKAMDIMMKAKLALDIDLYNNQCFFRIGIDAVNIATRIASKINVDNDNFAQVDWSVVNLGFGVRSTDKIKRAVTFDTSVKIRNHGLPPAGTVSIIFGI